MSTSLALPTTAGGYNPIFNPTVNSFPSLFTTLSQNPYLNAGITGLAGAFPTPGSSNTQSSGNFQQQGQTTNQLSPQAQALIQQLAQQYSHLINSQPNLQPYLEQQSQQINQNSNLARQAASQSLAARGLSTSPIAGTSDLNIEQNRIGQIGQLQSQIPLLQNQLALQNAGAAANFTSSIPLAGQASNTSGTQQQNQQTQTKTGGGLGGLLGGIGSALALFSDKRLKEGISENKDSSLSKIGELKIKDFNYRGDGERQTGMIAQDVEKSGLSHAVSEDPGSGMKMIHIHALIPHVIKAIQELSKKVDELHKVSPVKVAA